ncbi:TPA: hypothetical protein MH622_19160 [Klebsiella pneumoniae]|nr:hypothetical protein [Klebsiella pneumoniae]
MFSESCFTHGNLLRKLKQYVGRSLKVNGSFYRDTYISSCRQLAAELSKNLVVEGNCAFRLYPS